MDADANPTITAIHLVSRRSTRRQVELDSGETFSVDASLLTRFRLSVGTAVSPERRGEVAAEDERLRAKCSGFDLLRVRTFGRAEMAERLRRKGYSADAAAYAADALSSLGYVSDADFAEQYVASRQRRNPRSRTALRRELRRKGIDRTAIERAVAAISGEDEWEAALRAAKKQLPRYRTLPRDVARRRLYDFLLRRGFSFEIVRKALQETMGQDRQTVESGVE
jgi:regulatory protein